LSEYLLAGRNVVPRRLEELGFAWKFRALRDALAEACGPLIR
jgi:NAD dependent epimerase/dehydratase family enzyme